MGITGRTTNKLFKVRTYDQQNLYQVGVNGVTDITLDSETELYNITYVLDGITYKTNVGSLGGIEGEDEGGLRTAILDPITYRVSTVKVSDNSLTNEDGSGIEVSTAKNIDTTYEIPGFSFDQFTTNTIVKKEDLIGLIDKPIVDSNLFIERDEFTIFERHQRLSEINSLADLINYRNGYYEIVNTI